MEKQCGRYLGVYLGARDVLPLSLQMPVAGWNPNLSQWLAHAYPRVCAGAAQVRAATECEDANITTLIRFWLCLGLPCGEFGAGALVRGIVPALETIQYNTLRGIIGLMPANTISKVGLYAELGVWRIETRHKMAALRLLREIMRGDPDSDLRVIYNELRHNLVASGLVVQLVAPGSCARRPRGATVRLLGAGPARDHFRH